MVLAPHFSKRLTNHLTEQTKTNMERSAAGVETPQSEIPMEKDEMASPCEKSEGKRSTSKSEIYVLKYERKQVNCT